MVVKKGIGSQKSTVSTMKRSAKITKYLKYAQPVFYVAFIFIWFKGNFFALKKIHISYLIPFIPLIVIIFLRLFLYLRSKKIHFSLKLNKSFIAIMILIILVTAMRIPFLAFNYSFERQPYDDGVSALMGKHISEGKLPPIFWYGELRQGSLFQHLYALLFKIFGYSIFILRFMPLLIFLAFLTVQFFLLKEIFSLEFSFIACLFYVLPVSPRLGDWLSLDIASGLSLVLFLGILILHLTYLVYFKNRENLLPILGFIIGLTFWTHQITVGFIFTSFIFLALKLKFQWKKYANLFLMGCIGCFPLLLSEFFHKFVLVDYLSSGERGAFGFAKLKRTAEMVLDLISRVIHPLNYSYLALIFIGLGAIIYLSLKHRKFLPHNIYAIFFIAYSLIYFFSHFSDQGRVHRYLFPFFAVIPVLLLSSFSLIKKKFKYLFMMALFITVFFLNNLKGIYSDFGQAKENHHTFKKVVSTLRETKIKYWHSRYIRSYVLTSLSKEDVIVSSYTIEKYLPYRLFYYNRKKNASYVFLVNPEGGIESDSALNLLRLLQRFNIKHKLKKISLWWFIYDIESDVFPLVISARVPETIPQMVLSETKISRGQLRLIFKSIGAPEISGFRLNVEIPGFSSRVRVLPLSKDNLSIRIPFPQQKTFKIKYYLDYMGIIIKTSEKVKDFSLPQSRRIPGRKKREEIEYLSGFGPSRAFFGKERTICEKGASFRINKRMKWNEKLWIYLYSPFEFQKWFWYGNYIQEVSVFLNGEYLTDKEIKDGENIFAIDLNRFLKSDDENILQMKFKYSLLFDFAQLWETSVLLEKIEIKENSSSF